MELGYLYEPCKLKAEYHTLNEFIDLDYSLEHLDVKAWDLSTKTIARCPTLQHIISLDASRIGIDNDDVCALVQSPYLGKLRWLNLAGNSIDETGVRAICNAIKEGRFQLAWLDLRGTDFDATPYLDDDGTWDGTDLWRMPRKTHILAKEFGFQKWMTLGYPANEENKKYIPVNSFPPKRDK